MRLQVHQALDVDVYGDVARIYEGERDGIASGTICKLTALDKISGVQRSHYVVVRGIEEAEQNPTMQKWIRLDDIARSKLRVRRNEEYDFELSVVRWPCQVFWAWQSSDPATRVAMHWTLITLVLGVALGWLAGYVQNSL